jgi:hypothetical protein
VLRSRILGEFGDDPQRYADVKSRRNYAGTSPLTVAFDKKRAVLARHVRNRRLYDAIDRWAFCALSTARAPRLFYDLRRAPKTPTTGTACALKPTRRHPSWLPTPPHPTMTNTPHRHTAPPSQLDDLGPWMSEPYGCAQHDSRHGSLTG